MVHGMAYLDEVLHPVVAAMLLARAQLVTSGLGVLYLVAVALDAARVQHHRQGAQPQHRHHASRHDVVQRVGRMTGQLGGRHAVKWDSALARICL